MDLTGFRLIDEGTKQLIPDNQGFRRNWCIDLRRIAAMMNAMMGGGVKELFPPPQFAHHFGMDKELIGEIQLNGKNSPVLVKPDESNGNHQISQPKFKS